MDVEDDPAKAHYQPTHDDSKTCFEYGKKVAQSLKEKSKNFKGVGGRRERKRAKKGAELVQSL